MQSLQKVYGWRAEKNSSSDPNAWPEIWEEFELGKSVGDGGIGDVHDINGKPLVAKLFKGKVLTDLNKDDRMARRLASLVLSHAKLKKDLDFVTWPKQVLYKTQRINDKNLREGMVGFSMEKRGGMFSLREVLTKQKERTRLTDGNTGLSNTLHIALTIAGYLQRMHRHEFQFIFGDLNPNNILLDVRLEKVWFIDPDSYQFDFPEGPDEFETKGLTPGYSSPASHRAKADGSKFTFDHDAFVFAILLFHLLMAHHDENLVHPFSFGSGKDDEHIRDGQFAYGEQLRDSKAIPDLIPIYLGFPGDIRDAFEKTFTQPQVVSLAEWIKMLQNYRRSL